MARSFILLCLLDDAHELEMASNQRKLNDNLQNLNLSPEEVDYVNHFRLTEDLIEILEQDLTSHIPSNIRQTGLPLRTKILSTLSFLAYGSYHHCLSHQKIVGKNKRNYISQPSMSRALHQVIDAINHPDVVQKYIRFPQNSEEKEIIKESFLNKFGIPDVIGCIDSTLVALVRPKDNDDQYFCSKGHYARNVQMICDADLNILHVDSSFGAASHDSYIFDQSSIKEHLEYFQNAGETSYLLADSDYPQKPYVMTPIASAGDETPEAHYNEAHSKAHSIVESTIKALKARFRCLLTHKVLHYKPDMVAKIVIACCVLHNICNEAGIPPPMLSQEDIESEKSFVLLTQELSLLFMVDESEMELGCAARRLLMDRLWQARP